MKPAWFTFLNGSDIEQLELTDSEILDAVEEANSAVELSLTDIMDKIVVDDWGQAHAGPFGALRAHVDSGRLNKANLPGELGEIVVGRRPGRESPEETNLFWHRGLSLSDIALGAAMLRKAEEHGLGQKLRFS
ncbi:hypothetical protein ACW4TU_40235 [Streptomyces sp. QTS52]